VHRQRTAAERDGAAVARQEYRAGKRTVTFKTRVRCYRTVEGSEFGTSVFPNLTTVALFSVVVPVGAKLLPVRL